MAKPWVGTDSLIKWRETEHSRPTGRGYEGQVRESSRNERPGSWLEHRCI
jgi:hypothetical protein